jgi:NAD(P)H-hydrate epimerase
VPLVTVQALAKTSIPVLSVDIPSSWDVESGPPSSGPGKGFNPETLISLTAPKPCVQYFKGRQFLGGRFVPPEISEKYNLEVDVYEGIDQIVEFTGEKLGRL